MSFEVNEEVLQLRFDDMAIVVRSFMWQINTTMIHWGNEAMGLEQGKFAMSLLVVLLSRDEKGEGSISFSASSMVTVSVRSLVLTSHHWVTGYLQLL